MLYTLIMLGSEILVSSIGPDDFSTAPITVTFPPDEESVTASISLTQDMISEVEERFLLRLIMRTSIGGTLVEDLVGEPDNATVIIRDPGGGLHVLSCVHVPLLEFV